MCGRFFIPDGEASEELLILMNRAELKQRARQADFRLKRGEVCPGDAAVVLAPNRSRQPSPFVMRWGFRLDGRLIFNARQETAAQKPLFRDSMLSRRCAIPVSSFFEWDHRMKKPLKFRFWPEGRPMMYLAGLYRFEPDSSLPVFTVLTRQAQGAIADFHDRMPVILDAGQLDAWLDQRVDPRTVIDQEPPCLNCQAEETPLPLLDGL